MTDNQITLNQHLGLTIPENLAQLERQIAEGQQAFYQIGSALKTIRDERLYYSSHSDFETYCQQKWDMSKRKANYLIKAAGVIDNLNEHFGCNGNNCSQIPMPTNESQVRELAKLSPEEQREVWENIVGKVVNGETLTAKLVKNTIHDYRQNSSGELLPAWLKFDQIKLEEKDCGTEHEAIEDYDFSISMVPNIGCLNLSSRFSDFVGTAETKDVRKNKFLHLEGSTLDLLRQERVSYCCGTPNDFYRFKLNGESDFRLSLNGLSSDADLQLLNRSGSVIASSTRGGTSVDSISETLDPGTYYVRVHSIRGIKTNFNLILRAMLLASPDEPGNSISTALNMGTLNGCCSFTDFIGTTDTNDYYSFNLSAESDFSFSLNVDLVERSGTQEY